MQLRKEILSRCLLAIYLLVVLHHSVMHSHDEKLGNLLSTVSHQHEDFNEIHHEHRFHVGIFHLLGHLFEGINHSNDFADEHLLVAKKTSNKKVVDHNKPVDLLNSRESKVVFSVDAESLPSPPPYHLFLSHRLTQPNIPLRAPPALV